MQDFISDLLERVESSGGNFVEHAYGILGSEIMPLLRILFVLYVGWYGVQLFMGTSRIAVSEVGLRIVRMMAILWLIGNWGNFNTLFYCWLFDTPEDAGRAILAALNTGISEPTNGLSMIWHTASGAASALSAQTSWRYILPGMVGIVVLICTGLFIGVALAILILAKVMMWVLIGTAPIFRISPLPSMSTSVPGGMSAIADGAGRAGCERPNKDHRPGSSAPNRHNAMPPIPARRKNAISL